MASKKALRQDIIDLLTSKENLTKTQLENILSFVKNIDTPTDSSLIIPDHIRQTYPEQFRNRMYYNSGMEKLVWEEDD